LKQQEDWQKSPDGLAKSIGNNATNVDVAQAFRFEQREK
jgi:hypothetical protein